jgi:hypothetical protein
MQKPPKKPNVASPAKNEGGGSTRKTVLGRRSSARYGKTSLSDFSFTC